MSGLRELFFKQDENKNKFVSTFIGLDDLVKSVIVKSKSFNCVDEIKATLDLCEKMNRQDLMPSLNEAYIDALDKTLSETCQSKMRLNKATYDC